MTKKEIIKKLEEMMKLANEMIDYNEETNNERLRNYWLGQWSVCDEILNEYYRDK